MSQNIYYIVVINCFRKNIFMLLSQCYVMHVSDSSFYPFFMAHFYNVFHDRCLVKNYLPFFVSIFFSLLYSYINQYKFVIQLCIIYQCLLSKNVEMTMFKIDLCLCKSVFCLNNQCYQVTIILFMFLRLCLLN